VVQDVIKMATHLSNDQVDDHVDAVDASEIEAEVLREQFEVLHSLCVVWHICGYDLCAS
jgi:hypothetical protein